MRFHELFQNIQFPSNFSPASFLMRLISMDYIFRFPAMRKEMRGASEISQMKRKPRAVSSFLKKTYELLSNEENQNVVRWAPNGIGFIVINQDIFSKEILPKYFKHSNYSSFVRQLNMYNFHKIRENNTESYFHHQCFDRENEEKLSQIKRKPEKKKRKCEESDDQVLSEIDDKEIMKVSPIKKIKEEPKVAHPLKKSETDQKIESQKNTNHMFSSENNEERQNDIPNWKPLGVEQESDDKLSINNQISERIMPRLPTRELFYPSNNNLFPFGGMMAQTSTFCLFF